MRIIIIGAGGFIGSYLTKELTSEHQVLPIYKDQVDLFDNETVKNLLTAVQADVVINCLTFGGKENLQNKDAYDVARNLSLFYNFHSNSNLFKNYINIASGIEGTDANNAYTFSKKAIYSFVKEDPKYINLRLFGCFGNTENETRLLKRFLASTETFKIIDDRKFDYISIQDFYNIIKFTLSNLGTITSLYNTIDCVYSEKIKLSQFLDYFCDINNLEKNFIVESIGNNDYTGNSTALDNLKKHHALRLYGLAHGLKVYV